MPMAVMLCSQGLLTTALLLTGRASSLYRMITKGFTIVLLTRFCMVSIGWYRLYLSGCVCCESQLWANTKHTECSKNWICCNVHNVYLHCRQVWWKIAIVTRIATVNKVSCGTYLSMSIVVNLPVMSKYAYACPSWPDSYGQICTMECRKDWICAVDLPVVTNCYSTSLRWADFNCTSSMKHVADDAIHSKGIHPCCWRNWTRIHTSLVNT